MRASPSQELRAARGRTVSALALPRSRRSLDAFELDLWPRAVPRNMEAVILIGIQASGKSTFYRQRFEDTHVRINLDMLKTRHRERILVEACIAAKQPFVVDNTNVTVADRTRYIALAKAARFRVIGYYFKSPLHDSFKRNRQRDGRKVIPEKGIAATYRRLQLPSFDEGFDELFYVTSTAPDVFTVQE